MAGLLLVGASGLAREVLSLESILDGFDKIRVLDDDPQLWGAAIHDAPVVGGVDAVRDHPDHRIVVCVGKGSARRGLVERLAALGVTDDRYVPVLHPGVTIPGSCTVGVGSILLAGVVLTTDVHIGDHVVVMPHVTLTHDNVVEDYATLCAGVSLGGGVRVGAAAYLGTNASIREGIQVGPGAVLGMGAALLADLPPDQTWVGVPAHPLNRSGRHT